MTQVDLEGVTVNLLLHYITAVKLLFASLGGETKPFCRTHPVHNEDFPDTEPLLQELGCYGDRVEVTEPPASDRRQE